MREREGEREKKINEGIFNGKNNFLWLKQNNQRKKCQEIRHRDVACEIEYVVFAF